MKFNKITAFIMASVLTAGAASSMAASAKEYYVKVMKGDIDGNGRIDIVDYQYVKDHVNKVNLIRASRVAAADVNWDGRVDRKDYLAILDDINGNEAIKSGNVEGNNYVTSDDVQAILDHINGKYALDKYEKVRADINSDGKINITDVSMLQNYLTK